VGHETKHENKAEAAGKDGREVSSRFKTGSQTQANGFIAGGMGTLMPERMDCEEHNKSINIPERKEHHEIKRLVGNRQRQRLGPPHC
jgi:hypothetical protein